MLKTIEFDGDVYPEFQTTGNAARFIIPFAKEVCKGYGVDIGAGCREWTLPGANPIDPKITPDYNAMNLPANDYEFIFSSHCLEHIDRWVDVLDYWYECLRDGGILFLYLPHPSQKYWRPYNNRKHLHILPPLYIEEYCRKKGYKKIFVSGCDLNNSFAVMCEK